MRWLILVFTLLAFPASAEEGRPAAVIKDDVIRALFAGGDNPGFRLMKKTANGGPWALILVYNLLDNKEGCEEIASLLAKQHPKPTWFCEEVK